MNTASSGPRPRSRRSERGEGTTAGPGQEARVATPDAEQPIAYVNVGRLQGNASRVIGEMRESGRPTVVTSSGRPVALLYPVDQRRLEDFVFSHAPEFVARMSQTEAEVSAGEPADPHLPSAVRRAEPGQGAGQQTAASSQPSSYRSEPDQIRSP